MFIGYFRVLWIKLANLQLGKIISLLRKRVILSGAAMEELKMTRLFSIASLFLRPGRSCAGRFRGSVRFCLEDRTKG